MAREQFQTEITTKTFYGGERTRKVLPLAILVVVLIGAVVALITLSVLYSQVSNDLQKEKEKTIGLTAASVVTVTPGVTVPGEVTQDGTTTPVVIPPPVPDFRKTWRLPNTIEPVHYNLDLKVYLPFNAAEEGLSNSFTTEGTVTITLRTKEDNVNKLVLHASTDDKFPGKIKFAAENVSFASLDDANVFAVSGVSFAEEDVDIVTITLDNNLASAKNYSLTILFTGTVADDEQGLYRSSYRTPSGEKRWLAASQFQPAQARRVFPCFDEPGFRSTFDVSVTHDSRFTMVRGNGKVNETAPDSPGSSWIRTKFERTPPMPTYLLAFLISDFEEKVASVLMNGKTGNLSVIANAALLSDGNQGDFGVDQGVKIIQQLNEWFSQPYYDLFPKLDQAAIPDFRAGAMENWGLVLYRESRLLYKVGQSTANEKVNVALIIGHELAHFMFGDLVTCDWWSETWLNEGSARFWQYELVHAANPDWGVTEGFSRGLFDGDRTVGAKVLLRRGTDDPSDMTWNFFCPEDLSDSLFPYLVIRQAFEVDSVADANPLNNPNTNTLSEIRDMFSTVTYAKGGSVLHMIKGIMGQDKFYAAIKTYLATNRLGNVVQKNLLDELNKETPSVNFTARMNNWLNKNGHPVLTLSQDSTSGSISYKQERFLYWRNGTIPTNYTEDYLWDIPFTLQTSQSAAQSTNEPQPYCWLTQRSGLLREACSSIALPSLAPSSDSWFVGNVKQVGFYRVNYDAASWDRLVRQLETDHEKIAEENRGQMIDDAFDLARYGQYDISIVTALKTTKYLSRETRYGPLASAIQGLDYIHQMFRGTIGYPNLKNYVQRLMSDTSGPLYNSDVAWINPWEDVEGREDYNLVMHRTLVLSTACYFELPACLRGAKDRFDQWSVDSIFSSTGPASIVNIKDVLFCYGVREGNTTDWEKVLDLYNTTSTPLTSKAALLDSLACARQEDLLLRLLHLTLNNFTINSADVPTVFRFVSKFSLGESLAWEFLQQEWSNLRGSKLNILTNVASRFKTSSRLNQLRSFRTTLGQNISDADNSVLDSLLEGVQSNIKWIEQNYDAANDYFRTAWAA